MYYTTGKADGYTETFRSPFGKNTREGALKVLADIRAAHPSSSGWIEVEAGVEQRNDGLWYAWRKHTKYNK